MSIFGTKIDINEELKEVRTAEKALLVDVREPEEYTSGHIPGAYNLPLSRIKTAAKTLQSDEGTTIFVYCQSGFRSRKAAAILQDAGCLSVKNIGGLGGYKGELE